MPLPFNLNIFPPCVPASILILAFPSMVGTSTLVPMAASIKLIYKSNTTFTPSLFNCSCSISSMTISKSPGTPPLGAAFPLPLIDNCMPSVTPAGILILIVSSPLSTPSPLHAVHLAVIF